MCNSFTCIQGILWGAGGSLQSPLPDFCFNCVLYVEQDIMQENNYCLSSITMVSLWHFPLNNLLKIQSTFWPEGGGVEVKQKSCCCFKIKNKKLWLVSLSPTERCRMIRFGQIWNACVVGSKSASLYLVGSHVKDLQTNSPPLWFAFFFWSLFLSVDLCLSYVKCTFCNGRFSKCSDCAESEGPMFYFCLFFFSLFFNCHIWILKVQCVGFRGIYS